MSSDTDKRLLIRQRHLRNATLIEDFIKSDVYKEIICSDIDEMVSSISGGKQDGFFFPGEFEKRQCRGEDRTWLAGYQAALIELSMKWRQYIRKGEQVARESESEENEGNVAPLMEEYGEDNQND